VRWQSNIDRRYDVNTHQPRTVVFDDTSRAIVVIECEFREPNPLQSV
jgi:hypothetical protein